MLLAIDVYSNHYRFNRVLPVVYYARREPVCCRFACNIEWRSPLKEIRVLEGIEFLQWPWHNVDRRNVNVVKSLWIEINRPKSPFNRIQCECACETWVSVNRNMWQALQVLRPIQLLFTFGSFDWSMKRCRFLEASFSQIKSHWSAHDRKKKYLWKFFALKTRSRTVWSSRIGHWRSSCDLFLNRLEQAPRIKVNSFELNPSTLTHRAYRGGNTIHQLTRNPRHKRDCF